MIFLRKLLPPISNLTSEVARHSLTFCLPVKHGVTLQGIAKLIAKHTLVGLVQSFWFRDA
jgi:hypothetical protein